MNKVLLFIGVLLVVGGLSIDWWLGRDTGPSGPAPEPSSQRYTTAGPVVGFAGPDQTLIWLGIPYAAPPIDELRWRAPQPPIPWSEQRPALSFGPVCPQFASPLAGGDGKEGGWAGDEDCLTLNVYSPKMDAQQRPLPVMVWIHGGGNTLGAGSNYDMANFAAAQQLVVVTINYRLGLLGWLSHPALKETAVSPRDASGNFGVLDMIAALQWVQSNIASFGGDAGNVTIAGESAGGRNVYALLGSPLADGLFHRAIAQSGMVGTFSLPRAENYRDDPKRGHPFSSRELGLAWLSGSGRAADREQARQMQDSMESAELAAIMRNLSVTEILAPVAKVPGGLYRPPQNFRDGVVLPRESLMQAFADPTRWNKVPLLTGSNRDEQKLFQAQDPGYVKRWFGRIPRIRDIERYERDARYSSDAWKALAVDEVAELISESRSDTPVFAYRFDWDEGSAGWLVDLPQLLGAAHALELDFLYSPLLSSRLPGLFTQENAPGREFLSRAMRSYWGQFAYTGDPARGRNGDLPQWRSWVSSGGQYLVLDTPDGGGLRLTDQQLRVADLKQRLRVDTAIVDARERCAIYVRLFLDTGGADDFFDSVEYQHMDCGDFPPWSLTRAEAM